MVVSVQCELNSLFYASMIAFLYMRVWKYVLHASMVVSLSCEYGNTFYKRVWQYVTREYGCML